MAPADILDTSETLAILLAGGEGTRLHELSTLEAKPALPLAGYRLVDFACAAAERAGITRLVAVLGHKPATLAAHLTEAWGDRLTLGLRDVGQASGTVAALARALDGGMPREVLVLPADQVHALDLRALLAAHREGRAPATLARSAPGTPAPCVLDGPTLREAVTQATGDLWADLLPLLASRGDLGHWSPPEGSYWRDIDTLDDLRAVSLEFQGTAPCVLPPGEGTVSHPLDEENGRALALEVGGLRLSAPKFGARQRGRWTLIEDSVVLPGARVAPGARLSRTILAPGAVIPANLVVGDDPGEDARWFRVTPQGTTLVTAPMLAARAAERMRAQFGDRLPGLATPRTR